MEFEKTPEISSINYMKKVKLRKVGLSPLMIRIWYNFSVEVDQTSLLVALKKVSPPTKPLPKEEK